MGKKDALLEEALLMMTALASLLASSANQELRRGPACSRHTWILPYIYAFFWEKKITPSLGQTLSVLLSAG